MNIAQHFPILAVVIPLIAVPIIPLLGRIHRDISWAAAAAAGGASFFISVILTHEVWVNGTISYQLGGWTPPKGIEYRVDLLAAFVLMVISFVGFLSLLYAKKSVDKEIEPHRIPSFYAVFILFLLGLYGIVITGDIFNLYVFLEITSLAGYALIASGKRRYSIMASFNYLILGTIAATFVVLGIAYLYMATGTLNMQDLSQRLPEMYQSKVVITGFVFIVVGLLVKMALFPLHFWLPDAYKYSPSAVSAAMAATSTKVAAYVLIRMMFTVFDIEFSISGLPVTQILMVLACIAILAGSIIAISQQNIKLMLAYSSVGQIGYIVLALAMVNEVALTGGIVHVLNHAIIKGGLFFCTGAVAYKLGTEKISDMKGIGRRMPVTAFAFTIFALSIVGVPLTAGFVTKWYLITGAIASGHWFAISVILLSSLLTAIYFGRVVNVMYFGKTDETPVKDEAPMGMLVPTLIAAALCIVFGIAAEIPVELASGAADALFGGGSWK
ncbi:monovalent cation/H+ antiporter subunit D family protein [Limisalsivibrio acetivorans]|uniref:monovalent cation/H+ antiporter subunit D family protein n=1 Tax=Limisalsivibrio acetivorans TaxID=1304888 RepID=UPI0003B5DFCF|nr:monovalent cation/H+ antiporter subunit D family protein [Limisalsivibrio acetivorans]